MCCPCCCSAKTGGGLSVVVFIIIAIVCADNAHTIMQMIDWTLIYTGTLVALILAVSVTMLIRSFRRDAIPAVRPVEPLRVVQVIPVYSELTGSAEAVLGQPARTPIAAPKAWYEKTVNLGDALKGNRQS